jgi:hypothetical protein
MKKLMLTFATVALALASAASSHRVTVTDPTWLNGTQLQPGDYKVQVEGNKVTLTLGKNTFEAAAKVETATQKFETTALVSQNDNGKMKLSEIRLGGTTTKIVIDSTQGGGGQ